MDQVTAKIMGAMTYSPKSNEIGWLAVYPSMRRKGVGRSLVEYMLAKLPKTTPIKVKTFLITDKPGVAAQSFYRSMGFRARGIEEDKDNRNGGHPFRVFVNEGR
jgi:ribosomal protein S18 acetylase RimI-like enzyme